MLPPHGNLQQFGGIRTKARQLVAHPFAVEQGRRSPVAAVGIGTIGRVDGGERSGET